jgi:predicted enzyme related to lactoylglutathione lyase
MPSPRGHLANYAIYPSAAYSGLGVEADQKSTHIAKLEFSNASRSVIMLSVCFPSLLTAKTRHARLFWIYFAETRRICPIGELIMLKNAAIVPYIPVSDMARARKFYEQKVGLKPKEEYAGGVIYECGKSSWAFMYPSAGAGTSKASTAFWAVDDVAAEVAELKSRGVVFEEYDMPGIKTVNSIATAGGAKTAWFKDSEGNILAISQRVAA